MTVLLDTNVVSELLRPSPNSAVEGWVAGREAADLLFSAVGDAADHDCYFAGATDFHGDDVQFGA